MSELSRSALKLKRIEHEIYEKQSELNLMNTPNHQNAF